MKIKVGNVSVPIYKLKDGRFMVVWRERVGGPRRRLPYNSLEKARRVAEAAACRIARGAASELQGFRRVRVPELLEEFLAYQAGLKLAPNYLRNLTNNLAPFARVFPGYLDEVKALAISKYLSALNVGDRTRNNIRDSIITLYRFAKKYTFLRAEVITEAEKVPRIKLHRGTPRIYTPEQLRIILDSIKPEWLDWVLLGAFAGIRPEEIGRAHYDRHACEWVRLSWDHFGWDDRQIFIPEAIAKTGYDRYAMINDTLMAWIGHKRFTASGPVCPCDLPHSRKQMFAKPLPFDFIQDGLRKSYASYWQGLHKNMPLLKDAMGNSERVNLRFYQNRQPESACRAWFAILPDGSPNIIPMEGAA